MAENNITRDEARSRARLLSDLHYAIALDLTGDDTFGSRSRIRFRCAEPGADTFVDLSARAVGSAELNGRPLPAAAWDPEAGRLALEGLAAENELTVAADCAYEHTGVGLHRFVDPVDGAVYLHTQFEPFDAHRVFAGFDQPDLKATFAFEVDAPAGWEVVSGGEVANRPDPGAAGRWRFATTPRMSTYITALVAGPYHATFGSHRPAGSGGTSDVKLGLHCRQSLSPYLDADEIFEVTRAGFDFFETAFGQPYAFGKYDQLFVPEFNFGAMENAGCVTFSERHLFRSKVTEAEREARANTILHEMAHMWFGDLVTMRWWDDLWLNESFATYAAHLALDSATRFTASWTSFAGAMKTWAYRQDQLPSTHPIVADAPDVETMKTNFDGITYAKGASVLRQLVAWVGQDEFMEGVRAYFKRHAWGNTELADFLGALEETSGRDLRSWSAEWLETTGVNTLRPAFEQDDEGVFSSFTVEQSAVPEHPTLRSHRVAIGLYDRDAGGSLVFRERMELDVLGHRTPVGELVGKPGADLVLVNDGDLAYAKIRLDAGSLATLTTGLGTLSDPLARTLCWSAAWDMLRDAELPARRYLELVLANLAGEDEITTVGALLRNAEAAAVTFGDPANREPARRRVAEYALSGLRAAPRESDLQLAFARAFAAAARAADHVSLVRSLLAGEETIDGLVIDTELRWHLVRSLAAGGAGDELIAAEAERDPTDAGARHAAATRASLPDRRAKISAWESLIDGELPLAMMRAVMGGFRQPDQELLLVEWVEPYFAALQAMWDRRGPDVGMSFAEMMYPVGDGAVPLTDRYLARHTPPQPIRRILLEGRDQARRVARARAADSAAS